MPSPTPAFPWSFKDDLDITMSHVQAPARKTSCTRTIRSLSQQLENFDVNHEDDPSPHNDSRQPEDRGSRDSHAENVAIPSGMNKSGDFQVNSIGEGNGGVHPVRGSTRGVSTQSRGRDCGNEHGQGRREETRVEKPRGRKRRPSRDGLDSSSKRGNASTTTQTGELQDHRIT